MEAGSRPHRLSHRGLWPLLQRPSRARHAPGGGLCHRHDHRDLPPKPARRLSRARRGRPWGHTTLPDHMPSHHRAYSEWSPGRFLNWAVEIGPHTRDLVRGLLESRKHPELSYRSCLGLLNRAKRYSHERLEAACRRALAIGVFRQSSVRSILERGLDSQPLPEPETETALTSPVHENVRGAAYYQ